MKAVWKWFVARNQRITMWWANSLPSFISKDEVKFYEEAPFAWMFLLIPIAGIAFFVGIGWGGSLNEREQAIRRELDDPD